MTQEEQIEAVSGKLDTILGMLATRDKPSGKQITVRRVLEVCAVAVVVGLIIGGVLLLLLGKLSPEDIIRMLEAYKGS